MVPAGLRLLRGIAVKVLGLEKARRIWSRIDVVGDIAIIKKPLDKEISIEDMKKLAEALLEKLPYLKSVWLAASPVEGVYKTREYIHLAGEERSDTIYVEHGCRFHVDIRRVFITPRLNYEHIRIAKLVDPGEVVTNMFAGVGLFSIIIACKAKPSRVYSIDINPYAYKYMVENIKLNKVDKIVIPILGDSAKIIIEKLRNTSDRVLMPLPELSLKYLTYAVDALRDRKGVLHVYLHVNYSRGEDPLSKSVDIVKSKLKELSIKHNALNVRRVRPVGPRTWQTVVDVAIKNG